MNKLIGAIVCVTVCICLASCGGGGGSKSSLPKIGKVDIQMLSNEAELKKIYGVIEEKAGEHIKRMDEILLTVSSPSIERGRQNREDDFTMMIYYLYPKNKNKLYQVNYNSEGGWSENVCDIELARGVDAESFVLEEAMFDLSAFSADKLCRIVKDALAKHKDEKKYAVQYIKEIQIKDDEVSITIYSRLASNDVEQKQHYEADFDGDEIQ